MTLRTRILKLALRRPLLSLFGAALVPIAVAAAAIGGTGSSEPDDEAGSPRAVLGRVWFDSYPEKATDNVKIWIWLAGGIGINDSGSRWRSTFELFEFERKGAKLSMVFLQDKKKMTRTFKITECEEKPPFDLCLDLNEPLGGKKRYYGFGSLDDMDAKVPWGRSLLRSAEGRAGR